MGQPRVVDEGPASHMVILDLAMYDGSPEPEPATDREGTSTSNPKHIQEGDEDDNDEGADQSTEGKDDDQDEHGSRDTISTNDVGKEQVPDAPVSLRRSLRLQARLALAPTTNQASRRTRPEPIAQAKNDGVSAESPESDWPSKLQPMQSQRKAARKARLAIDAQYTAPLAPPTGPVRRSGRIAAQRAVLAEAQKIKAQARASAKKTQDQGVLSAQKAKDHDSTSTQENTGHGDAPALADALQTAKAARKQRARLRRLRKVAIDLPEALKAAKEARKDVIRQRRARKLARRLADGTAKRDHGFDGEHEAYKRFQEFFGEDWTYENWTSKAQLRAGFPEMAESEIGYVDFTFKDTRGRMRGFLQTQGVTSSIWHDGTTFHLEVKSHLRSKDAGTTTTINTGMLSSNQRKIMESMKNSPDNAFIIVNMHGLGGDETTWHFTACMPQFSAHKLAVVAAEAVQTAL